MSNSLHYLKVEIKNNICIFFQNYDKVVFKMDNISYKIINLINIILKELKSIKIDSNNKILIPLVLFEFY